MGVRYTICHWAINRTDPQNSLSMTLDVLLQRAMNCGFASSLVNISAIFSLLAQWLRITLLEAKHS